MFPRTYEQWRHCITVECGIAMTSAFITKRLSVWRDSQSEETLRFRRRYGDEYWQLVIRWFEQAERELNIAG